LRVSPSRQHRPLSIAFSVSIARIALSRRAMTPADRLLERVRTGTTAIDLSALQITIRPRPDADAFTVSETSDLELR
jgi:hypothetical protein